MKDLEPQTSEKKRELKTLFSNTVMLYIMQVSAYVFPLITFPWLTRSLQPEQFGVMSFANSIIVYFQLFVDFGFLLSATKDCSLARHDNQKLSHIVSSVIQAKGILSVVGLILMALLCQTVSSFRNHALYLLLSYLSVMLSIFVPDYLFRGLEKMSSITYRSIIARAMYTLLVVTMVHSPEDVYLVPVFNAISNLFIVLWSWWIVKKRFRVPFRVVSLGETWKALKDSAVFFASRIASTAYGASNVFVLGLVGTGDAAMGQFTAANSLITNGRGMFSPISDSLYPYMVKKKNYKLVKIVLAITAPLIVAGTAVLYVFADWFILLFCGEGYEGAVSVFRAMLPMFLITLPIYLLGFPTLGAMNKMKEANYTVMYAAAFHVVGLVVLYLTGNLTFLPVAWLTCASETVVLVSRIIYVILGKREQARREST